MVDLAKLATPANTGIKLASQPAGDAQNQGDKIHDLVIIGSGPAGYTAAIYAGRAQLAPVVLEGIVSGGALINTTEVENFPGFPEGIDGPDLMANMRAQAEKFGAELIADDAVEVDLTSPVKVIKDSSGNEYRAHAVILATGSKYRHLECPGEEEFSGKGVSWCATCDGFFYRGKQVAVVGGGDAAVEEATFLTRFAEKVTLIHRRDELRASKIMVERALKDPKVEIAWNTVVAEMKGDTKLTTLVLQDTNTGEKRELSIDGVFEAIGNVPSSALFIGQVEVDQAGYVKVANPSSRTNLPGVFACGDLIDPNYQQAITAAGSGCRAALDAEKFIADIHDQL